MSLALPAMSSRAPSAGLSVTSMPVAPSCAASTASVQSSEPDARRRASSSTPQASAQGMAAPPPSQGALMESLRLQCHNLRCRRRTPSAAKAAHVVDVVFNRSTGSHCPLERQRRRSKRLTTGLRLQPRHRSSSRLDCDSFSALLRRRHHCRPSPNRLRRPSSSVEGKDAPLH
jgi:hypothetical protein